MAEEKTPSFLGQPEEVTDRKYNNLLSDLTSQTVGGRSFSEISKAIQDAEVGGDKNAAGWPYIFTKSSGKSSAFGPAQIVYSTALDYFYDGANETEQRKNMKAGNFKEGYTQLPADVKSYIKKFIEQGIKKRNRKGGVYGSLGVGDISREDHEKYYPFLFGVHVQEKKKIADEDTVKSFVDAHYGSTTGSTEEETAAREFALGRLQTKVQASLGDTGIAEKPDTAADDFKPVTSDKIEMPDDVVEPGTTDTLEEVEQEQFQADVDAADRDEQLQQAESLKVQTAKAIPTKPEPEPEQPSFLDRLFGRDEPTQEALDAKKSVLERLGRFKNQPVVSGVPTMNKGGVSIKEQMSMFDDGGLLDEGGTTDPVSGNEVPPGSMQEEVRDDIPAQLSEGEFVFPADVVRYIGLEKLMQLRQEAKMGLKRMEAMGQMGNSDEAIIPDDLPFTLDDLELEDEPVEMQIGGFVDPNITMQQSQFGQMAPVQPPAYIPPPPPPPFVPTQQAATPVMAAPEVLPTFEQLMPAPEGRYDELVEFENKDTGQKMSIPFVNGEPIYPIPQGFTRVETDIVEPTPEPEVVPTARVESAVDDGGDDEMRKAEEEAMFGPGGGRVSLGGELYTGPTRFVGDNVKTRQISGTVQGATKVGVSFDMPGGVAGVGAALSTAAGLAFGKGIPESATATFFLNGETVTVDAKKYNLMKENKFRGEEAEAVAKELRDKAEVSRSIRDRDRAKKQLEKATKAGEANKIAAAELAIAQADARKLGISVQGKTTEELRTETLAAVQRKAQENAARRAAEQSSGGGSNQYESDKGESRNEYSFESYSDNVAKGTEDRGYGAAYDEDVLGLADQPIKIVCMTGLPIPLHGYDGPRQEKPMNDTIMAEEMQPETKVAFAQRKYSNEEKRKKEEEELEQLMKEQRGEVEEPEEEPASSEEKTFKKRYGDLRRHMQEKEKEFQKQLEELKGQLDSATRKEMKLPKSDEDLEAWARDYPDVAAIIETIAAKKAQEQTKTLEDRFKAVDEMQVNAQREKAEAELMRLHPDFDEIRDSDDFHEWADEQPKWVQEALYENDDDARSAARAIDLYKSDKNLTTKKKPKGNAAEAVTSKNTRSKPQENEASSYLKESEVQKMSAKEYENRSDEIMEAIRSGKFIYDISGSAR